jgi:hypothetical protein
MDPKNPTPEKHGPGTSQPGETPSRETRPEERPLTDNERSSGTEQDDKERRSNLAGDQDVDESDDTDR